MFLLNMLIVRSLSILNEHVMENITEQINITFYKYKFM